MTVGLVLAGSGSASTPDVAALDVTGDIDIRVQVAMADWTPAASSILLAKRAGTGGQRSFLFFVNTNGTLSLNTYLDGTLGTAVGGSSSTAPGFADGTPHWVRVTLDVDNGASQRVYRFFTSEDGVTWTQLGTTQTVAGATTIFASTATLRVGRDDDGLASTTGTFYRAQFRNGIDGTVVANPDFRQAVIGATTHTDSTGKVWTIAGTGSFAENSSFRQAGDKHDLQRVAQANYGLDLNGALREASGLNLDANGVSRALFGRELYAARDQVYAYLGGT